MIKYKRLSIPEVILIEPQIYDDDRGIFFESYNKFEFDKIIGRNVNFIQDNHSFSVKNVLRGLHYQKPPFEQAKLVRVLSGVIWDVAVDIRLNSKTYGKWVFEKLSAENKKQLWIPEGFAHGFLVLSASADVAYKTNNLYSPEHESTINWNDQTLSIRWPVRNNLIISDKDKNGLFI